MIKKKQLLLLSFAHSLNHSLLLVLPQILVLVVADLGSSEFVIGTIAMIAGFLFGFGSLFGGMLSDKIGEMKVIMIFLILSGLSTFLLLMANEIIVFAIGLFLITSFASLYHPTSVSLLSKLFQKKMGEPLGLHGVGGSIGVIYTPIATAVLASYFGWRSAFAFFGIQCLVLAAILFLSLFRQKTKHGFEARKIADQADNGFRFRGIWVFFLLTATIGLYSRGVELFFQTYIVTNTLVGLEINSALSIAAIVAAFLMATGAIGQWISGKGSDVWGSAKVLFVNNVGVVLGLLFLQLIPIPYLGVGLFVLLYGFCFWGHQPALNSLMASVTPKRKRGMMYGIYFFMMFGIGSLSQSLTGYMAESWSISMAFYILTLFAVIALFISARILISKK
jgi:MFS family permease